MSTQKKITQLVRGTLDLDDSVELTPETDLTTLGADSLDLVELVMEIEEEFDVDLPDEEANSYKTIGQIVEQVDHASDS